MSDSDKPDNVVPIGTAIKKDYTPRKSLIPNSPKIAPVDLAALDFFASDEAAQMMVKGLEALRLTGRDITIKVDMFGLEIIAAELGEFESREYVDTETHTIHSAQLPMIDDEDFTTDELVECFRECLEAVLTPNDR